MARPAPPVDTIRVAVSGDIFTHVFNNIYWLQVVTDGTRTVNDLATILDGVIAAYNAHLLPMMSSDVSGLTAEGVWQTGVGTVLADTRTASHAGAGTAGPQDAGASLVVSWKIGARYRGGKPRSYLPGPVTANLTNGSDLSAGYRTALAAAAVAFMGAVNAITGVHVSSVDLGTVSFFTAGGSETVPPTYRTPPVFEKYIGSGIRPKIGSQRRRILS